MSDREAFQKRVKEYLKRGHSSLTELALELNYSREHLTRMLHGHTKITTEVVQRLVRALAELGCLQGKEQARKLLRLMDTPDFAVEEWETRPLSELADTLSRNLPAATEFSIPQQAAYDPECNSSFASWRASLDAPAGLNTMLNFYKVQDAGTEAEPLLQPPLAMYEQLLKASYLHTASNLNTLASFYSHQGQYVEAVPLLQRTLAIYEAILGQEHSITQIARHNYLTILQAIEHATQAKMQKGEE